MQMVVPTKPTYAQREREREHAGKGFERKEEVEEEEVCVNRVTTEGRFRVEIS